MVTEYWGSFAEPTQQERELADKKRQLVDEMRAESRRIRESFSPVMKMHGDESIGFVCHDEFDTVERAAREYSASRKTAETELAVNEKQRILFGGALILSIPTAIGIANFLGPLVGLYAFLLFGTCVSMVASSVWFDDADERLRKIDLLRSVGAARRGSKGSIEWLSVGRRGVAFLDHEKRPTYVDFDRFSSVYADTQDRYVGFQVPVNGEVRNLTLRHPQTSDIPTTRAFAEDTVADYLADAIATAKSKAA